MKNKQSHCKLQKNQISEVIKEEHNLFYAISKAIPHKNIYNKQILQNCLFKKEIHPQMKSQSGNSFLDNLPNSSLISLLIFFKLHPCQNQNQFLMDKMQYVFYAWISFLDKQQNGYVEKTRQRWTAITQIISSKSPFQKEEDPIIKSCCKFLILFAQIKVE